MTSLELYESAPPPVDWRSATLLARTLVRPGPVAGRGEALRLVDSLHSAADRAAEHVADITSMVSRVPQPARVLVLDRARWTEANVGIAARLFEGLPGQSSATREPGSLAPLGAAGELGVVVAALASRVLGQFDPFDEQAGGGRLLLVAPNVLRMERMLGVDPKDFRLWVALHEQTHALQFAAAPWLADHLSGLIRELLVRLENASRTLSEAGLRAKATAAARTLTTVVRGTGTFLDAMVGPAEREALGRLTAVMALLEGHADVTMDAVGPQVVPSVRRMRRAFEMQRDGEVSSGGELVWRRLLGLNAKLAQYRQGAAFVRNVYDRVGNLGLNAVWTHPDALPTAREIADAPAWIRRVHG